MNNALSIFIGSGLGGLFRFWISNLTYGFLGRQFPYGTLIVNATGCFLMGLLFVLILERAGAGGWQLRSFLLIGFLGGYTTFSSFSIETMTLFENGDWLFAGLNIAVSVILCISLTWLGMIVGRQ